MFRSEHVLIYLSTTFWLLFNVIETQSTGFISLLCRFERPLIVWPIISLLFLAISHASVSFRNPSHKRRRPSFRHDLTSEAQLCHLSHVCSCKGFNIKAVLENGLLHHIRKSSRQQLRRITYNQ